MCAYELRAIARVSSGAMELLINSCRLVLGQTCVHQLSYTSALVELVAESTDQQQLC